MTSSVTDPDTLLVPVVSNSVVGQSMVIHSADGTRIACANLTLLSAASIYTGCASGNMSNTSSPTSWMSWNPDATILPLINTGGTGAGPTASFTGTILLLAGVVFVGWAL